MKKILIITYHFPPYRTSGVYRHLKFAKYLEGFGWSPYILTVKNPGELGQKDPSLMEEIPSDLPIHYTYSLEINGIRNKVNNILTQTIPKTILLKGINKLFEGVHKVIQPFLMIPDDMIGWLPHTTIKAWQLMKQENINIL